MLIINLCYYNEGENMKRILFTLLIIIFTITTCSQSLAYAQDIERANQKIYRYSAGEKLDKQTREMLSKMSVLERGIWVEKNIEPVYIGKIDLTNRALYEVTPIRVDVVYKQINSIAMAQLESSINYTFDPSNNYAIDISTASLRGVALHPNTRVITTATPTVRNLPSNIMKTYTLEAVNEFSYFTVSQQYNVNGNGYYSVRVY